MAFVASPAAGVIGLPHGSRASVQQVFGRILSEPIVPAAGVALSGASPFTPSFRDAIIDNDYDPDGWITIQGKKKRGSKASGAGRIGNSSLASRAGANIREITSVGNQPASPIGGNGASPCSEGNNIEAIGSGAPLPPGFLRATVDFSVLAREDGDADNENEDGLAEDETNTQVATGIGDLANNNLGDCQFMFASSVKDKANDDPFYHSKRRGRGRPPKKKKLKKSI